MKTRSEAASFQNLGCVLERSTRPSRANFPKASSLRRDSTTVPNIYGMRPWKVARIASSVTLSKKEVVARSAATLTFISAAWRPFSKIVWKLAPYFFSCSSERWHSACFSKIYIANCCDAESSESAQDTNCYRSSSFLS